MNHEFSFKLQISDMVSIAVSMLNSYSKKRQTSLYCIVLYCIV